MKMKRMRSFAVGAVACLAFFIAISSNDRAVSAEKISIGLSSTDGLYGPWFYAQEKGYLAKYGFESTMTILETGTRCVQALVAQSIDFCAADGSAMINAIFAGSDLVYLGTTVNVVAGDIYGNRNITSPEMIKGGKWGIGSFGSEAHMVAKVTIKHFKLSESDVTIVQLGNQNNRLAALDSGQIQVTSLAPPANFRAAAMGLPRLAKLADLKLDYLSVGPAVSKSYLRQHRASAKHFLQAMGEATAAYQKDRAGAVDVLQKWLKITDRKQAEDTWEFYAPLHDVNLRLTAKGFELPLSLSDNPKAATAKASDFADLSVLEELEKEGFFQKLK
jgi:NitT/TauT family transport system substrate-binding protein